MPAPDLTFIDGNTCAELLGLPAREFRVGYAILRQFGFPEPHESSRRGALRWRRLAVLDWVTSVWGEAPKGGPRPARAALSRRLAPAIALGPDAAIMAAKAERP